MPASLRGTEHSFADYSNYRSGFGQHADYVFGWQDDTLQRAMDSACYLRNCTQLTAQTPEKKNKCQVPVTVREDIDGCKCYPSCAAQERRRLLQMLTMRDRDEGASGIGDGRLHVIEESVRCLGAALLITYLPSWGLQ
jgi:hypothetical protein